MSLGDHSDSYEVLPDEVKRVLTEKRSRHFLFWKHESLFGLNCKNKTVYIDLNEFKDLEICYWSRAKGPGGIEIMVWPKELSKRGAISFCGGRPYSDQALEQFGLISKELSNFIGKEIKVVDCGPDY
jgi:hypothetical protein